MNTGFATIDAQLRRGLQTLWKRRWLAVSTAWVAAGLALPVVLLIPNRYEAAAQVYVDTQTVLKPLMQDLAYTPDIDQQVKMLARTLISRPNVERLVDRTQVGGAAISAKERQKLISSLMDRIKVTIAGPAVGLYSITFRDADPVTAKRTVEETLELFVNAGAHGKQRDSEEASQFIDEQIKVYEGKLVEAEGRLKDFKVRNFGVSGVANQDFFARMSVLSEEVGRLRVDLAAAEHSRDAYRRELSAEAPQLPPEGAGNATPLVLSEVDTRLEAQRKQLDELLRRYTEEHPDVIAARRTITQLESQKRAEAERRAAAIASGNTKAIAATSPVYQKIRIALAETEAQVASLRVQLGLKEARLEQVRATAGKVPQVEAELAQLNRDYDTINKKYQTLVSRRESASLGVKLDESSRLAEFRVVEPPRVSPSPVFPARPHIAAIAALVALLLGIAAPLVMEHLYPTFKDVEALQAATGRQVLGAISLTVSDEQRRSERLQGFGVAFASIGLLIGQVGWMAWLLTRTAG